MTRFILAAFAASSLLTTAAHARQADTQECMPFEETKKNLFAGHGEFITSVGVQQDGETMFTIFSNPETGTWTAVLVSSTGMACGVASGANWQVINPAGNP